jgi:hypothetical protein
MLECGNAGFDPLQKSSGPKCCDAQHGVSKDMVGCVILGLRGANETARVHHAARRHGGRVAA